MLNHFRCRLFRRAAAASALVVVIMGSAWAQKESPEDRRRFAVTELDAVGADFAYQGEYAGTAYFGGRYSRFGLQVIARGDSAFDAVAFRGGLPGAGWTGEERLPLTGSLEGDVLY
ncbi:MAG: hypothetical protein ACREJB_01800, partial [Planctomycetaceae bacterium]